MSRLILCVTGPMAAGKNVASDILESHGFKVIDADKSVHKAIEQKKTQILAEFTEEATKKGMNLLNTDGTINRRVLGALLFSNKELLKKQEAIIHPAVNEIMNEFIDSNPTHDIVLNATVLYKTEVLHRCNAIIFIDAPILVRIKRSKKRDNMPILHIIQRFLSQNKIFTKYKKNNSDIYRVWNTGTKEELEKKVLAIVSKLR